MTLSALAIGGGFGAVAAYLHRAPAAFVVLADVQKIQRAGRAFAIPDMMKIGLRDQMRGGGRDAQDQIGRGL